jgi:flagellar hook-associated protein 3 FlgL
MQTTFYTDASQSFTNLEQQLQTLQTQISTGVAVPNAETNPAAYVGGALDASQIALLGSDDQNQTSLQAGLGVASSTIQQASEELDSIQAVALQALNATTSAADLQGLAEQVGEGAQQLVSLANTQGANGNFIFSGTAASTQPFVESASGSVTYLGNDGSSSVEIAPGIEVNAALNGSVFTGALSGNGFASVSAALSNTGTATLLAVGVTQQATAQQFQQGSQAITLAIGSAGGKTTYTATQGGAVIGSGSATSGAEIDLKGVEFQLSGSAAVGDDFTIAPSRPQSVFGLTTTIQAALTSPGDTPAQLAQTRQIIGNALGGIASYQNLFSSTNAKVGIVLQTITGASTANANTAAVDQTNQANLTATNVPAALTSVDEQTNALEAAMKAFSMTENLSVFSFL